MAALEHTVRKGEAPALIWCAMFAGPFAWACDLGFSYVLEQHACSTGHHYVLHLITGVCALIALAGFAAGFAAYKRVPAEAEDHGMRPMDRTHFQTLFGMIFSLAFMVVIVAEAVPRWILHPCQ